MKKTIGLIVLGTIFSIGLCACDPAKTSGETSKQASGDKYVTSLTITASGVTAKDGFDGFMAPNATFSLAAAYEPADANKSLDITWQASPKSLFTITPSEDGKTATVKAKAEGDGTIKAVMYGENATDVVSNVLKFRIEGEHKRNADFNLGYTTYMEGTTEKPLTINTIYTSNGNPHMNNIGGAHVLVIPFGFQEDQYQRKQTTEVLDRMEKLFFGTSEEMKELGAWESLSSFYQKSSYGKSEFTGRMPKSWCIYNKSAESCTGGVEAAEYGRNWYINEYAKANHGALGADAEPLSWFDSDGDGFIDLIWVIYSHPTVSNDTQWWAYVTYTSNGKNVASPNVKTLGWASIDWSNNTLGGYDAHTYIHETGHTYGLPDYYDYNNIWSPMGGIDFMDHNMGDHNMYSKFQLGWTAPRVVDDDALITLRPGTTTGDCFIIPSPGYNGTAFDEYFMVELMAPVGLCEADYKGGYSNISGYSKPGVRILHIDARVYKGDRNTYITSRNQVATASDIRVDNSYAGRGGLYSASDYWPVLDKTGKETGQRYYTEASLIESNCDPDKNWQKDHSYTASNASLFTQGSVFNLSDKKGFAEVFMPSQTNLWNKAKTITGWSKDKKSQTYTIDKTITMNYELKVLSIDEDPTYGWTARVLVDKDAACYAAA